jgi:hypothetical protein
VERPEENSDETAMLCVECGIKLSQASVDASRYDAGYCDCCRSVSLSMNNDYWRPWIWLEKELDRRLGPRKHFESMTAGDCGEKSYEDTGETDD